MKTPIVYNGSVNIIIFNLIKNEVILNVKLDGYPVLIRHVQTCWTSLGK